MTYTANELVSAKFQDAILRIADSYGTTKEHMAELSGFITGLTPMELSPMFQSPEFVRYILSTGTKPTAPTISFPDMTIPDVDVPIPGFSYYDSPYASELLDALKANLVDGIENGGTGLGATVEAAIYARNELRDEQALQDQLDAAGLEWSDDGAGDLGLPDGKLLALKRRLRQTHLAGRQTASNDIMVKMAESARQQQEVYLKTGAELENIRETKHTADMSRALEAARVEPEIAVRIFEAAMMKIKVISETYNAIAAKANALAAIFKTEMDGYLADVEVGSKELDASVKKYDADVRGASAESEAYFKTDSNKIEQMKNYLMLHMEGMKALSELSAHICAAMATSVSASASLGDQTTTSSSTSVSDSTSYSVTKDISD